MNGLQHQLVINEIFYSIQGESTLVGRPCVFVRLTGCGLRCEWCDTAYAFNEGSAQSLSELLRIIRSYNCNLVEITGGEPLEQKEVFLLLEELCRLGYEVMVETGGHIDISKVDSRVRRIMDIKCPGSRMEHRNRFENIAFLTPRDEVKFVIADRLDYEWASTIVKTHSLAERCGAVLFSPVFEQMSNLDLAQWILEDHLPVRLQLQAHKYIWSPETRGV